MNYRLRQVVIEIWKLKTRNALVIEITTTEYKVCMIYGAVYNAIAAWITVICIAKI